MLRIEGPACAQVLRQQNREPPGNSGCWGCRWGREKGGTGGGGHSPYHRGHCNVIKHTHLITQFLPLHDGLTLEGVVGQLTHLRRHPDKRNSTGSVQAAAQRRGVKLSSKERLKGRQVTCPCKRRPGQRHHHCLQVPEKL